MKKRTILSALVIAMTIVSCQKAENALPGSKADLSQQMGKTPTASVTTYGGQGTGIDATIWNFGATVTSHQTIFAQTAALLASGGSQYANQEQANISDALSADSLKASTIGMNKSTVSEASVKNLRVTVGGHVITATNVASKATSTCGTSATGSSQITGLVINGTPITITGAANQVIPMPNGGLIIINSHATSKKNSGTLTVTGLHILLPNVADIKVASSRADIKC